MIVLSQPLADEIKKRISIVFILLNSFVPESTTTKSDVDFVYKQYHVFLDPIIQGSGAPENASVTKMVLNSLVMVFFVTLGTL